jgi:hypothetical protein
MKNKYFSAFFYLFFDGKCRKINKNRYHKSGYPVGLICLSKKIQNHSVDYCRGYKKSG